jgi:predicted small lipoprotein YifL
MRRITLLALLALAACGQKGNLYLPDKGVQSVPVSTAPTADAAAADETDNTAETAAPQVPGSQQN